MIKSPNLNKQELAELNSSANLYYAYVTKQFDNLPRYVVDVPDGDCDLES